MDTTKMKQCFFVIFWLLGFTAFSQPIQLTLIKKPPHKAYVNDINDFKAQLFVSAVNTSNQPVTFNLNFNATGPNGLTIHATRFLEEDIVLEPGESLTLDGEGFEEYGTKGLSENDIQPASERNYLKINRVLREGRYTFCIVAVSIDQPTVFLSDPNGGCDFFDLEFGEPPYIAYPSDNDHIPVTDPAILNVAWTHNVLGAPSAFEYTLKIVDITPYPGVNPIEIIEQSGIPVLYEDTYLGQFNAGLSDIDFEEGHQYSIRITAIDPEDHVRFQEAGKSNVVTIFYGEEANPITECACTDPSTLPNLQLLRPNPDAQPRKAKIEKINEYAKALLNCTADSSSHQIAYAIDWSGSGIVDFDFNTSPATIHDYDNLSQIPSNICVSFMIQAKDGSGTPCVTEKCLNVDDGFFDPPFNEDVSNIKIGTIANGDTIRAGENGEFNVIITQLAGNKSGYTGEGTVFIGWLQARVIVAFKKITVDKNKRLRSGNIIAKIAPNPPTYPKDWPLEALASNTWTNDAVGSIVDWLGLNNSQTLPYKSPNALTTPLMMPFGLVFGASDELALTEMTFQRNTSMLNIIGAKTTPLDWGEPKTIGFRAADIMFHPAAIAPSPQRLELVADLAFEDVDNQTSYTFIAPNDVRAGCFVEWGDDGYSHFGLEMETLLPRKWVVPTNDNGIDKVKVSLSAQSGDWDDFVLTGNLPKCEIVGTDGIQIEARSIAFDMSDAANPPQIHFPTNYQGITTNQFRGFFAQAITLYMPKVWEKANKPLSVDVSNLIMDKMGITMKAKVSNIADFNTTSVIDMAASVDDLEIELVANSLTNALVKGKIGLPFTDVKTITDQSKVDYSATLHIVPENLESATNKSKVQLVINPTENQKIDFDLIHSQLLLDPTTSITAEATKDDLSFVIDITGGVNIKDVSVGSFSLNSLEMRVEKMKLTYDSQKGKMTFDKGKKMTWTHSSPQKSLALPDDQTGFPISISNIDFVQEQASTKEYFHGKLKFNIILNLTKDIGGSTALSSEVALLKNSSFAKFQPKYIKTNLEEIAVSQDLGIVKINGKIKIRDADPTFGDGFLGELEATFKVPKAVAQATAEFGKVNGFRYWRVQAGASFAPPIPFGAINLSGLGGGAYYNMNAKKNTKNNVSLKDTYLFKPKKDIAGFMIMAGLSAPKAETFNSEMQVTGQMNLQTKGIEQVAFDGKFWVGADINKRPKAPIKGSAHVQYDFVNEIFDLTSHVDIDKKPIKANQIGLALYINGSNGKWFFKCGEPQNPNKVSIGVGALAISTDSYFMFGNDIPMPSAFSNTFIQGFKAAVGKDPKFVQSLDPSGNAVHGAGIALGAGYHFKAEGYLGLPFDYYAGIQGLGGSEFNLSLLEYPTLKASGQGLNGWLATGSIGFYASVGAGIYTKKGSKYTEELTLAKFGGAGYVLGQFPNPTYLAGEVAGLVKIGCFNDWCLINTSASIDFEYGKKVAPGTPNTKVVESVEQHTEKTLKDVVVESIDKHILKYVHPETYNSFPTNQPLAVKFAVVPLEQFEVAHRIFRFKVTPVLLEKSPNCSWVPLAIAPLAGSDGEVLYYAHTNQTILANNTTNNNTTNNNSTITNITNNTSNILNINGQSQAPGHALAPNTDYRLVIDIILQEFTNNSWQDAKSGGKTVSETDGVSFKTVNNAQTYQQIQCEQLYHQMTINEYMALTESEKQSLNNQYNDEYYISDDGHCECPRLTAQQKEEAVIAQNAVAAQEMENGILFEIMPHGEFLNGNFGFNGASWNPSNSGFGSENEFGNGINPNGINFNGTGIFNGGFSNGSFDFNLVNDISNGSLGAFGNGHPPIGGF